MLTTFLHFSDSAEQFQEAQSDDFAVLLQAVYLILPYISILPLCQVLSTRARKEVALADVKVQVCVYAFDCLYHNGASLLHQPLTTRREVLHASLVEVPGQLAQATTKISNDVEELEVSTSGCASAIPVKAHQPSSLIRCHMPLRLYGRMPVQNCAVVAVSVLGVMLFLSLCDDGMLHHQDHQGRGGAGGEAEPAATAKCIVAGCLLWVLWRCLASRS
jgi:hypothetical protein